MAADDGNPKASVLSQTYLGMLYARPDFLNLKKSFFWHSEATGNGSLESQGKLTFITIVVHDQKESSYILRNALS